VAAHVKSLWPESALSVNVRTPVAVLREQARALTDITKGILVGDVSSSESASKKTVLHNLDVIAPALGGFRRRLVTLSHHSDQVYPVSLSADMYIAESSPDTASLENTLALLFGSKGVISMLTSLIAQSNEATDDQKATDMDGKG
jgi:hypothetical protein